MLKTIIAASFGLCGLLTAAGAQTQTLPSKTTAPSTAPYDYTKAPPPPAPDTGKPADIAPAYRSTSDYGRSTIGSDGVSTVNTAAVPCAAAAHETDGTTTCIGIPARAVRARSRITVGSARH